MNYVVIKHHDEINICWEINRRLRDGWVLQGGISVTIDSNNNTTFYQAMYKSTSNVK